LWIECQLDGTALTAASGIRDALVKRERLSKTQGPVSESIANGNGAPAGIAPVIADDTT
jgi:hypothetical protein